MKITLITLAHPGVRPEDEEEHLGLGYLAAVARQEGHEVRILDARAERLSPARMAAAVIARAGSTDLIGVSILFQELIPASLDLVAALRRAGLTQPVVLGGHPPSFLYRELLRDYAGQGLSRDLEPSPTPSGLGPTPSFRGGAPSRSFDAIAVGEAEGTFADLLRALEQGRGLAGLPGLVAVEDGGGVKPAAAQPAGSTGTAHPAFTPRPLAANLDDLPFPARDTLPAYLARSRGRRVASILRSRGCYGNCSFCDTRAFYSLSPGPAWRVRSAANVADEVESLVRDYGVDHVRFWDDNFMGPGARGRQAAEDLARELLRRRLGIGFSFECRVTDVEPDLFRLLKEAGLTRVFLGVEAMNQRQLDFFNKKVTVEDNRRALTVLESLDLDVTIGIIMFDPDTTVDELNANLSFLRESFGSWGAVKTKVAQPWNRLTVYAGTPLASRLAAEGRLKGTYAGYDYDFSDPTVARIYASGNALRRLGLPLRDAISRLRRRA